MTNLQLPVEMFPMNAHDVNAVAALDARVQAFPWSSGNFNDSLAVGHSCWVCRVGGDLVGFSVVMAVLEEAHLLNIGVYPAYQGKGFGGRLLLQAMDVAVLNGAAGMFLEVRISNTRAATMYRHFGFRQIGTRKDYYPAQTGREDALVFKRELP